jgi:hypothetical protein
LLVKKDQERSARPVQVARPGQMARPVQMAQQGRKEYLVQPDPVGVLVE